MIESNATDFVLYKGKYYSEDQPYITIDTPVRADSNDITKFKEEGYEGGIYPLYNYSLPISTSNITQEKAIAANRSGLTKIFIPIDNEKDVEDIPVEVRNVLESKPVSNIKQILEDVFA